MANPALAKKRDEVAERVKLDRKTVQVLSRLELDDQVNHLKDILSQAWKKSSRKALIGALETLQSMTGPVTLAELDAIQEGVAEALGTDFESLIKDDLISTTEAVYKTGLWQVLPSGASIMFNVADLDAIRTLNSNARFWIKTYFDDNMQEAFRAQLNDYFLGGYTRKDLATLMRVHFADMTRQKENYWDLLADHTATKVREIGRLAGYDRAGVTAVRVKARLDEKTTEFCRRLHGHVIAVSTLKDHVNKYFEACKTKDKEAIKASWPWWPDKDAERKLTSANAINRQIKRGTIGMPPYHARCRTITVAEFTAAPGSHIEDENWKLSPFENPIAPLRADPRDGADRWTPVTRQKPLKPRRAAPAPARTPAPAAARVVDTSAGLAEDVARQWEPPRYTVPKLPDIYLTEDLFRPPRIPKPKGWEEIPNTQAGSNTGGQFIGPDGKKYYVKFYSDVGQAKHEMLANDLTNKLGGIGAPKTKVQEIKVGEVKKTGLVTEWIDDAAQLKNPNRKFTAAEKKQLAKHYLNASLLGNWDVVGMEFDNLVKAGRKWYCIDQGGAFIYRARGGLKDYGAVVAELESLLLPGRKAGKVFNRVLKGTIEADPDQYIKWLQKLTDRKIRNSVKAAGLEASGITDTISARRDYIIGHLRAFKRRAPGLDGARPALSKNIPARDHLEPNMANFMRAETIQKDAEAAGVTVGINTAKEVSKAVSRYTGSGYRPMRNAQMGRENNPAALNLANMIEEYLDLAPPFPKGKPLYRGMSFKKDFFKRLGVGGKYELNALASFTSKQSSAFSGDVMLIVENGMDYATSVRHLSQYPNEWEVLASGRNVVKITKQENRGGKLWVWAEVAEVKPLQREVLKMAKNVDDEQLPQFEEKPEWLKLEHSDPGIPYKGIDKDGKQFLFYDDGTEEEVGPDHPLFNPYQGL